MQTHTFVGQFVHSLKALDACIQKAIASAEKRSFSPENFVEARLAPDMYPLVKQVQAACDAAKFCTAYLADQKAPAHPDTETTIAQIRERIAKCIEYVESVPASAFEGADDRRVAPQWLRGKWVRGEDYVRQFAIPNFYFHVATAYAILRHNGVDVGKMDFIGPVVLRDP